MNTTTKTITAGLLAVALALGGLGLISTRAHAASGEGAPTAAGAYLFDQQGSTGLRDSIAVADTLTLANVKALPAFYVGQHDADARPSPAGAARENLGVSMRFSSAAATVTFVVVTFSRVSSGGVVTEYLKDVSIVYTATAGSVRDENSLYVAPTITADSTAGWSTRIALTGAPSAGTVSVRVGSY